MSVEAEVEHARTWEAVTAMQWAITEEYLRVIADCALGINDLARFQALQSERGRPLTNSYRASLRGDTENVAVIPVVGPIFPRANLFSMISGATSTDLIARDLRTALDSRTVDAIILEIDSPGGAVAGINELSGMMWEGNKRKPVYAYASHYMASAAYWIGSATKQVVAERTAILGSIGVVMRIEDTKGRDERSGVRTYSIVSNVSPDKLIDPSQDEGRAKLQKNVDDLAAVFVDTVARNRGITSEQVIREYGRGGTFVGDHAVAAGLADRTGTLEDLIAELSAEGRAVHNRRIFLMARGPIIISTTAELQAAHKNGHTIEEISVKAVDTATAEAAAREAGATAERTKLEAAHATDLKAKTTEAREEGMKAERTRISGIQAVTMAGFEKDADKAIADGTTAEAFAVAQATAAKSRGTTRAQQQGDAPRALGHGGAPGASEGEQRSAESKGIWDRAAERANARLDARK